MAITRRHFGALTLGAGMVATTQPLAAQDRLQIAAVNYPLAYFAERIAGDLAEVSFPVPDGVDPSFWRPSISEISAIQSADLILLNGASFADWTTRVSLPRTRIVMTSAGFEDAFIATESVTHSHGEGGAHSHTGTASYVWLDFDQAILQAEAIAAGVTRRVPEAADSITANLQALIDDLSALDAEAQAIGMEAEGMAIIASHPRYQYFARTYGFDIASLEWDAVTPPSEADWQALAALTEELGAQVFVWEAAPADGGLERMAELGLANAVFPPLATRPAGSDFLSGMRDGLAQLRNAVAGATGG